MKIQPNFLLFLGLILLIRVTLSIPICPTGFSLLIDNKCVQTFKNSSKHMAAEQVCRNFGGTLVNVKNSIETRAISTFAASSGVEAVWIGVYCFNNGTSCYNDDGTSTLNGFMMSNIQLDSIYDGNCVYMNTKNGKWLNADCEQQEIPFVCEVPVSYSDSSNCTYNFNGYCYFPSHEFPDSSQEATYSDASNICKTQYGATLISFHSIRETDYIKSIVRPVIYMRDIFLGAQAILPDTFDWEDNSDWDFSRIDPTSTTTGDCLSLDGQNSFMLWRETSCTEKKYFICKRRASDAPEINNQVPEVQLLPKYSQLDASQCNSPSILMAPITFTSYGWPNTKNPAITCTWQLGAIGAYHGAVFFPQGSGVNNQILFYDEDGYYDSKKVSGYSYISYSPTNVVRMVYSSNGAGSSGFKATFLAV